MLTFQEIITKLNAYWAAQGCLLQQSYDLRAGAGTFHPETFLRSLGKEPYKVAHPAISTRPSDGRYGQNPNRLQRFTQYQVLMKPSPDNIIDLYLHSLEAIGFVLKNHDIRFVHDDWASPSQGAAGLGWEVWCDGMEVTQFTYFQQIGGIALPSVPAELAYGLERLSMFLQGKSNVYDVQYNDELTYGDVFLQNEEQTSAYNFEHADVEALQKQFCDAEKQANALLEKNLPLPAYDRAIEASNLFNLLDARNAISVSERVGILHRVRDLCCKVAEGYVASRKEKGYPLYKEETKPYNTLPAMPSSLKKAEDFILEIGTEPLPAAFIGPITIQLETKAEKLFLDSGLSYQELAVYATPNRLTVHAKKLSAAKPKESIEKQGPKLAIIFDESEQLTKAGLGFIKSIGLESLTKKALEAGDIPSLYIREDGYVVAREEIAEQSSIEILASALPKLITSLTFPKQMRWGTYELAFARPIRTLLCMHGTAVIPLRFNNVVSSAITMGHRQLNQKIIKLSHASKYLSRLKRQKVLASIADRKMHLELQLDKLEKKHNLFLVERDCVLAEVIHLSEYPTVAMGTFDEKFLSLPDELLITEMIEHQKYWPLRSADGKISNRYAVAVDRKPTESILRNFTAVLEARFADGYFLFEQDKKTSLETMAEQLKNVAFYKEQGSMFDKSERIKSLAAIIAKALDLPIPTKAAELCKTDLVSKVVFEFPDLQGVMGKYYALHAGEDEETAVAIEEHWWPTQEASELPTTHAGAILAIADKIDNLLTYTRAGVKPSSSKDPLGLRRSAIGILRILIEHEWSFDLSSVIEDKDLLTFISKRLKTLLVEHDFKKEEINAIGIYESNNPYLIYRCVKALHNFRKESGDFDRLHEIYKRTSGQIAGQSAKKFSSELVREPHERALFETLESTKPSFISAVEDKEYARAFLELTKLNSPLVNFFDNVRVLDDDLQVRDNRIALLQSVAGLTSQLVDFSKLDS